MNSRAFRNPIIPGFYPDPSICRVGEDYFLVTSSFEYFPGVPLFHSRDLVHWRQLGHVLDRPSQLDLSESLCSQGIFAPSIRHHDGVFYMVTTCRRQRGDAFADLNFVVTATDPAGPWSELHVLEDEAGIIDPSLFFDDDGRAWYTANRRVDDPPYEGYREIWMQEFDPERMRLVGERRPLWSGALKGAGTPEAPHLYKVEGAYYLLIAEGGTYHQHAVSIARSDCVTGPYEGNPGNPILTHRHLGLDHPITNPGHADLVETQNGEWWMVALASRPYGGYFYNLGRETFLAPVRWEEGWPVVSPGTGRVELEHEAPDLPEHRWPSEPACDHFDAPELASCWNVIRTPPSTFWNLAERRGHLRLTLRPHTLSDPQPAFIGRRQRHIDFAVRAKMAFAPATATETAGLALLQSSDFYYALVVVRASDAESEIRLVRRRGDAGEVVARRSVPGSLHYLKVEARGQDYSFFHASAPEAWQAVAQGVDGRILSTPVAGGFVGAYIGMYATSGGVADSGSHADYDYFEYQSL